MALPSVGWATYPPFEGPIIGGRLPYVLPANAGWREKLLYVTSATEGNLDAVNLYDPGICSVGALQFIDATYHHVTAILGEIRRIDPSGLDALRPAMEAAGVTLEKNGAGAFRWRRGQAFVEDADGLRWVYLRCSGRKGDWGAPDSPQRQHARRMALALSVTLAGDKAQRAQVDYILPRLESFGLEQARRILWDGTAPANNGIQGAARCLFLTYAVNNPAMATRQVAGMRSTATKWSAEWLNDFCRALAVGSGFAHWPDRYDRVRPRIEAVFGVDIEDFADDLRDQGADGLGTPRALQSALATLGFDPGPLDGHWGKRSTGALSDYQRTRGLLGDGMAGPQTRARIRTDLDSASPAA